MRIGGVTLSVRPYIRMSVDRPPWRYPDDPLASLGNTRNPCRGRRGRRAGQPRDGSCRVELMHNEGTMIEVKSHDPVFEGQLSEHFRHIMHAIAEESDRSQGG